MMITLFRHKTQSDDEAFDALFRASYPALYRHAYALLSNEEDSRDVVSDVFEKVLNKRLSGEALTTGYLMTLVHNRALDVLRHKRVEDEARREMSLEKQMFMETDTEREERLREILRFVESNLTPQTQKILRMCYAEKRSYREVAEALGISIQAVNKHISQALRLLRERFNPYKNK